jgi:hypothetical protein
VRYFWPQISRRAEHWIQRARKAAQRIWRFIGTAKIVVTIVGSAITLGSLLYMFASDRAAVSIVGFHLEPVTLTAGQRTRLAVTIRNAGKNFAKIEAASTDKAERLPESVIYDHAHLPPFRLNGGESSRLISDLIGAPLVFSQEDIDALKGGGAHLRITGFIKYSDKWSFVPGGNFVVGFCYEWDPLDTSAGNFVMCADPKFTYARQYWLTDSIQFRSVPMIAVGPQPITPATLPLRVRDPKYPITQIESHPVQQ